MKNKECSKCGNEIKEKESAYCGICFVNKMWELDELEEIKKIIDKIIERRELEPKKNPYNKNSYEDLF
jgi:NMD protein affecting ribosome stability and mRNA decay